MIIYSEPKDRFHRDVGSNRIADRIERRLRSRGRRRVGRSEVRSWQNSMLYVDRVLDDDAIPADARVSIEYTIPQTSKRIDVIVSGRDEDRRESAVIIELKQWESAATTPKDAIVSTWLGGGNRETEHPSYQAWTYAALLRDFNETVQQDDVQLAPCAYLHNCQNPEGILDEFYREHLERAPVFLRPDAERLQAFIRKYVRYGDSRELLFRIDQGRIRPSKSLADALVSMLNGNQEFLLIDDQKLVYETALALADEATPEAKRVLIVEGGPGTGKSVVAINLLVEMTARGMVTQYVSRNAAPREVYAARLTGTLKKTHISNLFRGSGGFTETEPDTFDALIVDEAHRLTEKSGFYGNLGVHQIRELISAAKLCVFFIDEDQRVTIKDVGTTQDIEDWARRLKADVRLLELASQFRCSGSDGYLGWLDNTLQIRETANPDLEGIDYDLRVFDTPGELRDAIYERNRESGRARLVAGYCWDWKSKKNPETYDIEFPDSDFRMRWNLDDHGSLWIEMPESIREVGCIHTCQGLELEYVGVIIGPDLVVRDGRVLTDASKRAGRDKTVHGLKRIRKQDPIRADELADRVIKNTYRTLMTRGQRGCFIYCTDPETREYFRSFVSPAAAIEDEPSKTWLSALPLEVLDPNHVEPYVNAVPLYDLQVAAGAFAQQQTPDEHTWVKLPPEFAPREGMFVAQVVGDSMNRRIPNGAWCLFRADPGGSRNGKIVVVQHRSIQDPEFGVGLTVKRYESTKMPADGDSWQHERIVLHPDSTREGYASIILEPDDAQDLRVVGELVAVLA